MSDTLKNYAVAIAAGDLEKVAATLSTDVKVFPPAGNQPLEGKNKAAVTLSAAAGAVADFRLTRTYDAGNNWHTILFDGTIDGTPVQFIDQVHVGENDLVDHVDIFFRPTAMAESLLVKMGAEVKKRTAAKSGM